MAAAAEGRPRVVLVRGEAGIGKTRLVGEAIERARAAGSPILSGACLDLEGEGLPYLPLVEALRNFARSTPKRRALDLLGPARQELAGLVPEIAEIDGFDEAADAERPTETPQDRGRLFERLLGFFDRLGSERPALAVVEDVQWIDPATHDLVTYLVRNVTDQRLVAILTCRTDDLAPGHPVLAWLAELGRAPGAVRIDLGRLRREDVDRQLASLKGTPVPEDVAEVIWRRSEGHPLFAEELLAATEDPASDVPPSLVEVLLRRVAHLGPLALQAVQIVAIAGRSVDERLLAPLLEATTSEIGAAFREATAAGVLAATTDGRYGFRHELLREAVERELSAGERREIHASLARVLEQSPGLGDERRVAATAELARHWAGADVPDRAHRASLAAADAAEAVHAFADAHRQLERAIALEDRLGAADVPSLEERVTIRRRAATVADLGGARARASELVREALTFAEETADPRLIGILHGRLAFLTWASGRPEDALVEHRRAVELVPDEPPSIERAAVLGGLGGALMGLGRWAESRPICEAAIDCAVRVGATSEESRGRGMLGSDLVALGETEEGLEELREAHRLAGPEPTELWVVTGHNLALNLLATDRLAEAETIASETLEGARAGGLERRYGMDLAALLGDVLIRLGRWSEADATTVAGTALDQQRRGTPYLVVVRSRLLARRGETAAARRDLATIDRNELEPDLAVLHAIATAELEVIDGRADEALTAIQDALPGFEASGDLHWGTGLIGMGLRAAAEMAEAARAARDDEAVGGVRARASALVRLAEELAPRVITDSGRAWIATARAELTRLDGQVEAEPWAAAIAAWDQAGDASESAYARYRFAESGLRRVGVRADVGEVLTTAWRSAVELGAVWLIARLEELARRARLPLSSPTEPELAAPAATGNATSGPGRASNAEGGAPVARRTSTPHSLSAREIEVLRLVAAGRSNGEIGDALFITRKTAGVHVTHILDKLGVSNRVEAAMAAARLGLLEQPDELVGEQDRR